MPAAADEDDSYTKEETKSTKFVNLVHAVSLTKQASQVLIKQPSSGALPTGSPAQAPAPVACAAPPRPPGALATPRAPPDRTVPDSPPEGQVHSTRFRSRQQLIEAEEPFIHNMACGKLDALSQV